MKKIPLWKDSEIIKDQLSIVQINLGDKCNQRCSHCHINASPYGDRNMSYEVAVKIVKKLKDLPVKNVEFTGGAPEMNPNLKYFIEELAEYNKNLTVRTNLTVLANSNFSFYMELFRKYKVKIIASLPSLLEDVTDNQRGRGVFRTSLKVLKKLNEIGYGRDGLCLDLVYNPPGDFLPPDQFQLEREYKQLLKDRYDIDFNNLITMVNLPIKRFKEWLEKEGRFENYINELKSKYNPETLNNLMCKKLVSVDYKGDVYDCDFNLALDRKVKNYENIKFWEIDFNNFTPRVNCDVHCYACTAISGSSCYGALVKNEQKESDVRKSVKEYYGEILTGTHDLKTNACCTTENLPQHIRDALTLISDEIKMKYYGCGSPIPLCLEGLKVLDVGCGTGRDVYVMSQLVGENGFVYGIDMTENQLNIAKKYIDEHTKRFGYEKANVGFILDSIENISQHFEKESLDLVISNCVINLLEDKELVLEQIFNILKEGGEFYFSDIYTDRRSPEGIRKNPILYNECLGGALYYKDFERIAKKVGFPDVRVVSKRNVEITNPQIKELVGNIRFFSITYRLWKLNGLEDACEDYGHIAIYKGGILESPHMFELDSSHIFYKNKPERVCGNTALMLGNTRYKKYFEIIGNFEEHFGLFENCPTVSTKDENETTPGGCC